MTAPTPLREPRRHGPGQRVDGLLQRQHLLARRVHELDVLGQRLAQRAGHRFDATVGHQAAADLLLDDLAQLLEPLLELLVGEPIGQLALVDLAPFARLGP